MLPGRTVPGRLALAQADELDGNAQLLLNGHDDTPFAVPSSLVSTIPVTSTISPKTFAWIMPFWPVVASMTRSTSVTGASFSITRLSYRADPSGRPYSGGGPQYPPARCKRLPLAGLNRIKRRPKRVGALLSERTVFTPTRSPQVVSCSEAAARKVSAAPESGTDRPQPSTVGNLTDGRGLTHAVHANDQHHAGVAVATGGLQLAVHVGADNLYELLAKHLLPRHGVIRAINAHAFCRASTRRVVGSETGQPAGSRNLVPHILVNAVAGQQETSPDRACCSGGPGGRRRTQATRGGSGISISMERGAELSAPVPTLRRRQPHPGAKLQVRGLLGSAQNGEKHTGNCQFTPSTIAQIIIIVSFHTSLPAWGFVGRVDARASPARSRLDTIEFSS